MLWPPPDNIVSLFALQVFSLHLKYVFGSFWTKCPYIPNGRIGFSQMKALIIVYVWKLFNNMKNNHFWILVFGYMVVHIKSVMNNDLWQLTRIDSSITILVFSYSKYVLIVRDSWQTSWENTVSFQDFSERFSYRCKELPTICQFTLWNQENVKFEWIILNFWWYV